jgi:hypothetical protein
VSPAHSTRRARVSGFLLTAAVALLLLPASASAVVFGADMTQSPGNSTSIYSITNVLSPGGGADNGSPINGILMSVRIRTSGAAGDGVIRILSQTSHPDAMTYGFLNNAPEIPVHVDADGTVAGHVTQVLQHRPIAAGERLAWYINDSGFSILEAYNDSTGGDCAFSAGAHPTGTSQDYHVPGCNQNLLLLSGTVEPDADGDGFGDETEDQGPTNASTHGPCPQPPASPTPAAVTPTKKKCKHRHRRAAAAKKSKKRK